MHSSSIFIDALAAVNVGRALPAINNLNELVGGAHPT